MRRSSQNANNDLLNGWKQIAKYLDCSTRQALRYKKEQGLPILSLAKGVRKGPILASKRSLDLWLKGTIENVVLKDNQLIAFGKGSNPLWAYEFPARLRSYSSEELTWRLQIVDLHGAGQEGVLAAVRFRSGAESDKLMYFTADGNLLWSSGITPSIRKFDGEPFEDAWIIKHAFVIADKEGGTIWIAVANGAGWGGCILRFDPDGRSTLQFANVGHVERIGLVTSYGEKCLFFCGENNDFDRAFVALIGAGDSPASSIQGKRKVYRFAHAPEGRPRKVILFPRTELIVARKKPYGHAITLRDYKDRIIVHVETGGEGASFLYHLSTDLEPMYVFPSGSHEYAHQALEQEGILKHSWIDCPERRESLPLRIWTPRIGWKDRKISWRDDPWKDDQRQS